MKWLSVSIILLILVACRTKQHATVEQKSEALALHEAQSLTIIDYFSTDDTLPELLCSIPSMHPFRNLAKAPQQNNRAHHERLIIHSTAASVSSETNQQRKSEEKVVVNNNKSFCFRFLVSILVILLATLSVGFLFFRLVKSL